jgi:rhodanese-related sulfurtransferase
MNVDELLAQARSRLERLSPQAAREAMEGGAVLVDIRAESQRAANGVIPGSVLIPRNVLEWRADPTSDSHDERMPEGARVILICGQGYQSSLAAATLRYLGVDATDVEDGFEGWVAARLPVEPLSA